MVNRGCLDKYDIFITLLLSFLTQGQWSIAAKFENNSYTETNKHDGQKGPVNLPCNYLMSVDPTWRAKKLC